MTLVIVYEFLAGVVFISLYYLFQHKFSVEFFTPTFNNWALILILASVCMAYAFTASVKVMEKLSPYTVMLTTNLEPVYGIVLAYFIIRKNEHLFYIVP
jgi:drug/metabolite transporter (DMT)-like permease